MNKPLPAGWAWATVGDICFPTEKTNPRLFPERAFIYIEIGGIGHGNGKIVDTRTILGADAPSRARQVLKAGDIILSTVRIYQRKTAIVSDVLDNAIASTGFAVLRPTRDIVPMFLLFQVMTNDFVTLLNEKQTGTSYPAVRDNDVRMMPFRVAPLAEQERIVERIEEIFSRLDAVESMLTSLLDKLELLRSAILAEAFHTNRDLPPGWKRVKLDDVTSPRKGKVTPEPTDARRYLSLDNIESKTLKVLGWEEASKYRSQSSALFPGDVAYVRLRPYLNKVAIVDRESLGSAELIVLPKQKAVPRFLGHLLSSRKFTEYALARSTGDRPRLKWASMRAFSFVLPPWSVQCRIVKDIDKRLTSLESVGLTLKSLVNRVILLRQSVLAQAFAGRLVPQDPADEPASALLERIAESRLTNPKRQKATA